MEILTILAIILGPIFAVLITRIIDKLRAAQERKYEIFRTLMRTRETPLNWEHVGALNLVEVEFRKHSKVIDAWKAYLEHLGVALPPIEQKQRHDDHSRKRRTLLTKLIDEIAKTVGIDIKQLDIFEGNYMPQGWADDEWNQRLIQRGLINVLYGKAPLTVQQNQFQEPQNPYPPPPSID